MYKHNVLSKVVIKLKKVVVKMLHSTEIQDNYVLIKYYKNGKELKTYRKLRVIENNSYCFFLGNLIEC